MNAVELAEDEVEGKPFLKCEYNKDGDSYRSPWSNQYFPAFDLSEEQPAYPSGELLEMEVKANEMFARYAKMYYDCDFYTSVYFFDTRLDNGFGSCWLVKKCKCLLPHLMTIANTCHFSHHTAQV